MYLVPTETPKYCNKCPFGMCHYNYPLFREGKNKDIDKIDGRENEPGTYGYVCNVDFHKNGRYTKVLRSDIGFAIEKPKWCGLKEVEYEQRNQV